MHIYPEKKQESGRSMVEMLGVVIVMAVLTVGSITLFRYARDTIHANTIVSEVRMRLVALSRHGASKNEAASLQTLKGFWKTPEGDSVLNKYSITLSQPAGNKPVLNVENIALGVCNRLKSFTSIPMTINNMEQALAVCETDNTAQFNFALLETDPEYIGSANSSSVTPSSVSAISSQESESISSSVFSSNLPIVTSSNSSIVIQSNMPSESEISSQISPSLSTSYSSISSVKWECGRSEDCGDARYNCDNPKHLDGSICWRYQCINHTCQSYCSTDEDCPSLLGLYVSYKCVNNTCQADRCCGGTCPEEDGKYEFVYFTTGWQDDYGCGHTKNTNCDCTIEHVASSKRAVCVTQEGDSWSDDECICLAKGGPPECCEDPKNCNNPDDCSAAGGNWYD